MTEQTTQQTNSFSRRNFIKTSTMTIGAIAVLSEGRALAQAGGGSSYGNPNLWWTKYNITNIFVQYVDGTAQDTTAIVRRNFARQLNSNQLVTKVKIDEKFAPGGAIVSPTRCSLPSDGVTSITWIAAQNQWEVKYTSALVLMVEVRE